MYGYRGTFSVDIDLFHRLDGVYHIGEYTLIPCIITPKNSTRGCSNFILQFDFNGVDEKGIDDPSRRTRNSLINMAIGAQKAKTFISWFVTCTRYWARLSTSNYGPMMKYGPYHHVLIEDYDKSILEKPFHVDKKAQKGEFVHVERPCFDDIVKVSVSRKLPSDFAALTQKLFSLKGKESKKFFNACLSYQFALENWIAYRTVCIVALASAVEAMMTEEYASGFCSDAKKVCPLKKDVMKRFRKFFESNLQYPLPKDLEKFLNRVYSKRSSYVHKFLLGKQGMLEMRIYPTQRGRRLMGDQRHLETLVNATLIEWLRRI